ncbi:MAG: peptidyl-prolyl cis-trans isomerase, partial [Bacteroidota bacterium]
MKRHSWLVSFLLAAALGCQRSETPQTPVARVDGRTLTLEEIAARFDSLRGASEAQVHAYVQRWITDELLYREAVRRGLDQQPSLATQLEDIRRQLVINALLDREVYDATSAEGSPDEVHRYYEEHQREFMVTSDVVLVSFVLFVDREAANAFRTAILRGIPWSQALHSTSEEQGFHAGIVSSVDSAYFTQQTLFPVELWRTATGIGTNNPSFPVRTEEGYYVLIVWKLARQGQQAELPYVEKEIRSRLTIERRRELYDALLENLRSK